jgi:hypothetical protein
VSYTTIQIDASTRKKLAELKEYPRETYDELLNKLLDLVPAGDEEGRYRPEFRASLLRGLLEVRKGRVHSTKEVRERLGVR